MYADVIFYDENGHYLDHTIVPSYKGGQFTVISTSLPSLAKSYSIRIYPDWQVDEDEFLEAPSTSY